MAFGRSICWTKAWASLFSLKNGFSATSFRAGKSPVPCAHISFPTGPEIQRRNFQAASLFWAWLVTVLSDPRTTVPLVIPLGRVAMSYVEVRVHPLLDGDPHGPSNIMAMLPAPKLARFSRSPFDSTPGTATLCTLTRSTYHWTAFTPAGLLKTALLLFCR